MPRAGIHGVDIFHAPEAQVQVRGNSLRWKRAGMHEGGGKAWAPFPAAQ